MRLTVPKYYKNFKCIADKCKDSCCIGWEMPVDEMSVSLYKNAGGEFGERLRASLCECDGDVCFKQSEGGRCAFLDSEGLCDIIKKLGDDALCQICRDHPRYFNIYGDECEGGLGLACEEASRMIVSLSEAPSYVTDECDAEPEEANEAALGFMRSARENIVSLIFSKSLSASVIIASLDEYAQKLDSPLFDILSGIAQSANSPEIAITDIQLPKSDIDSWFEVISRIDALNERWTSLLSAAKRGIEDPKFIDFLNTDAQGYARALLYYFIHRYFLSSAFDGDIIPRVRIALVSVLFICAVIFDMDTSAIDAVAEVAKDYSKNIEYSTDNVDFILGAL